MGISLTEIIFVIVLNLGFPRTDCLLIIFGDNCFCNALVNRWNWVFLIFVLLWFRSCVIIYPIPTVFYFCARSMLMRHERPW